LGWTINEDVESTIFILHFITINATEMIYKSIDTSLDDDNNRTNCICQLNDLFLVQFDIVQCLFQKQFVTLCNVTSGPIY